jgi:signal transduction histidine kinase
MTLQLRDGPARVVRVPLAGTEVVIAMSTLPLERRLVRLRRSLVTVLPLILVLGALGGAWASGLVLRPIVRVAESAERIAGEVEHGAARFTRLAHELRTPVAIIRSDAEVTLRAAADPAGDREALARIATEADELGVLVGDLLLIARGDSQALHPARDRLYLDDLVNPVLARARALPTAAGRELRHGEFEAAPVLGDRSMLERALMALVHNALLHAPGSPVELSAGTSGEDGQRTSWVTVRDFGPGVPLEQRERIFERFTRGSTAAPGTGLGLAIAQSIAEAHGGSLRLDPVQPGAAFTLRLPAPPA